MRPVRRIRSALRPHSASTTPSTRVTRRRPAVGTIPPTAVASGAPTSGNAPLAVSFDGSGSSDPDAGDTISYSWDLNGDGTFGDSTVAKPSFTYTSAGTYNAVLKVTDNHGASSTSAPVTITVSSGGGGGDVRDDDAGGVDGYGDGGLQGGVEVHCSAGGECGEGDRLRVGAGCGGRGRSRCGR